MIHAESEDLNEVNIDGKFDSVEVRLRAYLYFIFCPYIAGGHYSHALYHIFGFHCFIVPSRSTNLFPSSTLFQAYFELARRSCIPYSTDSVTAAIHLYVLTYVRDCVQTGKCNDVKVSTLIVIDTAAIGDVSPRSTSI